MAKKFLVVLLALCVVFAMAGCGGGGGDGGDGGGDGDEVDFTLKIAKNQYSNDASNSKGNQFKFTFSDINKKISAGLGVPKKGDSYTVSFECTPDMDGTQKDGSALSLALVDDSEEAGYWLVMGEWDDATLGEATDKAYANIAEVKKDTKITFPEGTLTVSDNPETNSLDHIVFVLAMEGQSWDNEVTLTFTKFKFKKN